MGTPPQRLMSGHGFLLQFGEFVFSPPFKQVLFYIAPVTPRKEILHV